MFTSNLTVWVFIVDYSIPMEKGAYNGLIPDEQFTEMKERLTETNAHRHSNLNKYTPTTNNGDIDPASNDNSQMKDINLDNRCSKNAVFYSADLKGGRNSGLFTRVGHVDDIKDCIQQCCITPRCDLAYMDKTVCYTVICHFPSLCQPIRAVKAHTTLGYVARNGDTVYDPGRTVLPLQDV